MGNLVPTPNVKQLMCLGSALVHAETEGVPRRVEEYPEGRTGLVLMLGRAESEHCCLCGVEVIDDHVEMHLLRHLLSRPSRRGVGLHLLEGNALAVLRGTAAPRRCPC